MKTKYLAAFYQNKNFLLRFVVTTQYLRTTIINTVIISLITVLLVISNISYGQGKVGDIVEKIPIDKVLNSHALIKDLHSFKEKLTIIEFWATWCVPCIQSFEHFKELQKTFGDKINIVAVSDENEELVRNFISKRDMPFLFALDTTKRLSEYFPTYTIPHTILIGPDLKVLAITSPHYITNEVINSALKGENISLVEKKFEYFNQKTDYFNADSTTLVKFQVGPAIPSLPTRAQTWYDNLVFKDRRLTMINYTIEDILRWTYPKIDLKRTIYDSLVPDWIAEKAFCIDIITAPDRTDSLFTDLRNYLAQSLGIKCRIDSIAQPVFLLKRIDGFKFKNSTKENIIHTSDNNKYIADSVSIADFISDFIQGYSSSPVIDKTGLSGCYDIDFKFDFQKSFPLLAESEDFSNNLKKIGFRLEKATGKAPTLFIYQ